MGIFSRAAGDFRFLSKTDLDHQAERESNAIGNRLELGTKGAKSGDLVLES